MFKRLKQKIESSDSASTQDGGFGTPGGKNEDNRRSLNKASNFSSSNLKKTDSVSSLNSSDDMVSFFMIFATLSIKK